MTEKDHFKSQAEARIARIRESLIADDPAFDVKLRAGAEADVLKSLDLENMLLQAEELEARKQQLDEDIALFGKTVAGKVLGKQPGMVADADLNKNGYRRNDTIPHDLDDLPDKVKEVLTTRITALFNSRRRAHPVGQKIQKCEDALDNIKNAIMAASTHAKLETAWKAFEEETTALQDDARQVRNPNLVRCRPENTDG